MAALAPVVWHFRHIREARTKRGPCVWKLSKLEIRGFKSFADAAKLDFPEGITAVVGPNGCGKSNISDAILWVLGEQSTRALRAHRMQDVIFQGTATRKAIGLAEVTLFLTNGAAANNGGFDPLAELEAAGGATSVVDAEAKSIADLAKAAGSGNGGNGGNGDGAGGNGASGNGKAADGEAVNAGEGIAIDASGSIEIEAAGELNDGHAPGTEGADELPNVLKITRRLFRSGDSEYLLNGDKCRLRDIRERLAGTGLGSRACFLIGQGKIDQILSANSMERRAPLEEAAGITLYRQRRHLTKLKLEAAAQDLARIDDIYQEVGRHMRSLKRQAGRARRYKKLRAQQRRLERAWLHGELSESRQRVALSGAAVSAAREAENAGREKLETATQRFDQARQHLRAGRQAEQERRQRLYQNQLEQERLKAEAQRQEDRGTFATERLAELERRAKDLEERQEEAVGLQVRREEVAQQSEIAAQAAKLVLTETEEDLEAARRRLDLAMRPAANAPAEEGEARALSADLVVEEADFPALSLALGDLLDAKVLPDSRLGEWLDENRRHRPTIASSAPFGSASTDAPRPPRRWCRRCCATPGWLPKLPTHRSWRWSTRDTHSSTAVAAAGPAVSRFACVADRRAWLLWKLPTSSPPREARPPSRRRRRSPLRRSSPRARIATVPPRPRARQRRRRAPRGRNSPCPRPRAGD